MSATTTLAIPDLGDVSQARVIEILVQVGQTIRQEQSILTLESDKASMEVPASRAGVVREILLRLGDEVSTGSPMLVIEAHEGVDVPAQAAPAKPAEAAAVAQPAAPVVLAQDRAALPQQAGLAGEAADCDVLVLGGGPGGYSAAFRAADLGLRVTLVERYGELGGVCLNVGCIPSKALLHAAGVMEEVRQLAQWGLEFGEPKVDLAKLRAHKCGVTGKLNQGLAAMAKARGVEVVRGQGSLLDAQHMLVELTSGPGKERSGQTRRVSFKRAILANGSQAIHLPFLPKDPRIVDSSGALELASVPTRMLVIGGGIIGLEMATVYAALGSKVDIVEMGPSLMPGADRDLVQVWEKHYAGRFGRVMLSTKTTAAQAKPQGIEVSFAAMADGRRALASGTYDLVLQAVGRRPNGDQCGVENAGLQADARGYLSVDAQQRTAVASLFAIGDVVGQPMLAHKAVHEGHVAAEVIAGELLGDRALASRRFDAKVIPSVAYTDPEVAWVGLTQEQAQVQGVNIRKAVFPWAASGRALANGRSEGLTKLILDADSGKVLGAGIVGTHAGDLIGEVALAVEMGADELDLGLTIHPHPTLCESVGLAAEVAHGSCTDVMPLRKKRH